MPTTAIMVAMPRADNTTRIGRPRRPAEPTWATSRGRRRAGMSVAISRSPARL
ncbi:hypothetical protein [Nonomuraea endophytica]|uniref:hypothetical protein n=1 Tax=Nonomuraea endophytica TaxID=714136 RepID=UPI0037CA6C86